ncbi:uncharacterized protein LOC127101821 [Lathyrus oleraceus]|uniref:uncharacterized protein LOC127101821 n=1 Tax=Pisum sativum TaxID=3888 RepID=UPI0021CF0F39|nr:uncharacterized protein LOC127101821 [Pisum sativum]
MEKTYRRNMYQYKLIDSKFDQLRKLCDFLVDDYRDFLLAPTLEEFAHLLQLPVKNQAPYMNEDNFPNSAVIAHGNTKGFPSKFLFEKATVFANNGSWDAFYARIALLIYGLVLFPSVDGFIGKVSITIFISQNPVPTLLADVFFSFHWRNMKGGTINCCILLLHKWIITHLPKRGEFANNVGDLNWSQRLMSLDAEDVTWYNHGYIVVELIFHCGEFPNVPLISTKGRLINYNLILSLCQLGHPLKKKHEDRQLEELGLAEGVENPDLMKKVRSAWGKIQRIRKKELGKQMYTMTIPYSTWVKSIAKMIKLSYPWEPSMSLKTIEPHVATISEVDCIKETIRKLEKENADLRSSLGKIEQNKRRKVGEALNGTYDTLATKKKQLAEAQYCTCKLEIDYQNQIKNLQDHLEKCQKGLKEEKSLAKKIELTLSQHQSDLDKRFEEIRELKGQAHRSLRDRNQLKDEAIQWETHSRHLQVLLDQKEAFVQDLLN